MKVFFDVFKKAWVAVTNTGRVVYGLSKKAVIRCAMFPLSLEF